MNLLTLFIFIGAGAIVAMFVVFYFEVWKNSGKRDISSSSIPVFTDFPPHKVAKQMMGYVRKGHFLLHTLTNDAPPFDDRAYLAKYNKFIRNPSAITYIQALKGGEENE